MKLLVVTILVLYGVSSFEAANVDQHKDNTLPGETNDVYGSHINFDLGESDDVQGSHSYTANITNDVHSRRKRAAGDPVSTSGEQYCILYNDISGTAGAQKLITDYVADLEELGWKEVVSSMKCFGFVYEQCVNDLSDLLSKHAPLLTHTFINESAGWLSDSYERVRIDTQMWIFYQDNNFDPTGHSQVFYLSRSTPQHFKLEGRYAHHNDKIVSMRYAGAIEDPFLVDSITLYEHHWYGGEEYFTLEDIPHIPPRMNDKTSSIIVTGQADWTIYEDKEFGGRSHCLTHGTGGKEFFHDIESLNMNDLTTSIKKGC